MELDEVVGGHEEPPLGAHGGTSSAVETCDPAVVFGVTEDRLDRLLAFSVETRPCSVASTVASSRSARRSTRAGGLRLRDRWDRTWTSARRRSCRSAARSRTRRQRPRPQVARRCRRFELAQVASPSARAREVDRLVGDLGGEHDLLLVDGGLGVVSLHPTCPLLVFICFESGSVKLTLPSGSTAAGRASAACPARARGCRARARGSADRPRSSGDRSQAPAPAVARRARGARQREHVRAVARAPLLELAAALAQPTHAALVAAGADGRLHRLHRLLARRLGRALAPPSRSSSSARFGLRQRPAPSLPGAQMLGQLVPARVAVELVLGLIGRPRLGRRSPARSRP